MADTHVLIQKIDVGPAGAASVTFNNIPQTGYTDLVVVTSTRNDASWPAGEHRIFFNGSTSNFSSRALYGTGNAGTGTYSTNVAIPAYSSGGTSAANTFGSATFYIPNYTSSNFKSVSSESLFEDNAAQTSQYLVAGLWSDTAAITSITFVTSNNSSGVVANFVANSTFSLYGVSRLGVAPTLAPKASGGDIIETDGTYWYHAFKTSGSFTPLTPISADVLVVAGGGSGATMGLADVAGGGGGAGGALGFVSQSLSTIGYTVVVGAGGATPGSPSIGIQGSGSRFGSLTTAVGGGYGGYYTDGGPGGSGGGAGGDGVNRTGGTATSGQGNNGGNMTASGGQYSGGGGGGYGAAGANAAGSGAAGGAGTSTVTTYGSLSTTLSVVGLGVSGFIAGGGGGGGRNVSPGAGGSGGGGTGGQGGGGGKVSDATNGTANTGSGGGGAGSGSSGSSWPGGAGGSGLVVVRYAV